MISSASRIVAVALPVDLVERLNKIAEREGNPRSAVVRRLLIRVLNGEPAPEGAQA